MDAAVKADANAERLADLSALSKEHDAVLVEVLYRDRWVRFDIATMQLRHLPRADVIAATFSKALADVGAPEELTAD